MQVTISGQPTAGQFTLLDLDVERLIVDNLANTQGVAWTLADGSLQADLTYVQLDFGADVLDSNNTVHPLTRSQVGLDFDVLPSLSRQFDFDGARLTSENGFAVSSQLSSAALGAVSASDTLTLSTASGNPFTLTGMTLAATSGAGTRDIVFTATTIDGTIETITAQVAEGGTLLPVTFGGFRDKLIAVTWSLAADEWIGSIDLVEIPVIDFDGLTFSTAYREDGIRISTDGALLNSRIQAGVTLTNALTVDETEFALSISKTEGAAFDLVSFEFKDTFREATNQLLRVTTFRTDSGGPTGFGFFDGLTSGFELVEFSNLTNINSFNLPIRSRQVLDNIVVRVGGALQTITFNGLTDPRSVYIEDGFRIERNIGLRDPGTLPSGETFFTNSVEGGLTPTITDTIILQREDGSPLTIASVDLMVVDTRALNEYVDFTATFADNSTIVERVSSRPIVVRSARPVRPDQQAPPELWARPAHAAKAGLRTTAAEEAAVLPAWVPRREGRLLWQICRASA